MNDDLKSLLLEVAASLIVATITAIVAMVFTKKYFPMLSFASEMKKHGFQSVSLKRLNNRELRDIFNNAKRIRIMYVSGVGFFTNGFIQNLVANSQNKNIKIQFLCSKKDTVFIHDIENLEKAYGTRELNKFITPEIETVEDICKNIKNIEIKNFSTEYRMPFILADYKYDDILKDYSETKAWLYITFPPYRSDKSIILRGYENKKEKHSSGNFNLIYMLNEHFESIWSKK